jgi:hypothetical protein
MCAPAAAGITCASPHPAPGRICRLDPPDQAVGSRDASQCLPSFLPRGPCLRSTARVIVAYTARTCLIYGRLALVWLTTMAAAPLPALAALLHEILRDNEDVDLTHSPHGIVVTRVFWVVDGGAVVRVRVTIVRGPGPAAVSSTAIVRAVRDPALGGYGLACGLRVRSAVLRAAAAAPRAHRRAHRRANTPPLKTEVLGRGSAGHQPKPKRAGPVGHRHPCRWVGGVEAGGRADARAALPRLRHGLRALGPSHLVSRVLWPRVMPTCMHVSPALRPRPAQGPPPLKRPAQLKSPSPPPSLARQCMHGPCPLRGAAATPATARRRAAACGSPRAPTPGGARAPSAT